jgi:lipopolysaccharide transport system ATP-binding protein
MSSKAIIAQSPDVVGTAICVENVSKSFHIYEKPRHRLQQFVFPQLDRVFGKTARSFYKEFWALNGISLRIGKGETVGIIGKNGSGKSTLLQIICGTLTPTSGHVETHGRVAALLELGSGFNPDFSGRENVYLNGSVLGLSREEIEERFDDITAFADIGDFIDQPVKTYSSGMMVRLAFAVAINADPEILVVDEALSVGDELFQRKCFSRIEAIRDKGATILFVSHSGGAIVELCDRAILVDSGELLASGEPKSIVGQYQTLLYAPADKRPAIRDRIKRGAMLAVADEDTAEEIPAKEAGHKAEPTSAPEMEEQYNPALVPQSTIEYESRGARIEKPRILLEHSDTQVNCLCRGRVYRYAYDVRLVDAAHHLRFGMMIKTVSGVDLGGGVSAAELRDSVPFMPAGSVIQVEFRFTCSLNPGTYFLNAGVQGVVDGEDTYLHRLLDVAMFQVMPEPGSLSTGVVHFDCVAAATLP